MPEDERDEEMTPEEKARVEWHDTWSTPEPLGEDGEPVYKVIGREEPDARG